MDHTHPWSCQGERGGQLPLRLLTVGGEVRYMNKIRILLGKEEHWVLGRQLTVSIHKSIPVCPEVAQ